jgi:hypothetical protein
MKGDVGLFILKFVAEGQLIGTRPGEKIAAEDD